MSIYDKISNAIQAHPDDYGAYQDYYAVAVDDLKNGMKDAGSSPISAVAKPVVVPNLVLLAGMLERRIPIVLDSSVETAKKMVDLHRRTLLSAAPYDFESYLLYTEFERDPKKKFYPPRRKRLRALVRKLQALTDDELDLLSISLPPGTGKTTLAIFYLTWLAGRNPDEPILTGSHSNSFIRGTYDECLRLMSPTEEYLWKDVFPGVAVVNTNAKDCRIDLGRKKRFETLQFTSIGTGNAGLYRAVQLLYCDDLVSGLEVALSIDRLDKLWDTYTTDLRQRKLGDHCKELHIATRWSVHDVIGHLEDIYGNDERAAFVTIPALDENDESNFDYKYGVGFNTEFYHAQRDIMDEVNWKALYMNEPVERHGLLFHADQMQRYFELPDEEPDAVWSVCDTKDRGSDYCVMPIAYQYGDRFYIEDVICDNGTPDVIDVRLAEKLVQHKVKISQFESNSAGGRTAQAVQQKVWDKGGSTKIITKYTVQNKMAKILAESPFVKDHFLFKDDTVITHDKEYRNFLSMLFNFSLEGKNKHDDVPDACAMLSDFVQGASGAKVEAFRRPF